MKIRFQKNEEELLLNKLKYTFLIILKVYILVFVIYSILGIIDHLSPTIDFSIAKSTNNGNKTSILILALKTLFIAPIIEEFIFRKPIKHSKVNTIILLIVFFYSLLMSINKPNLNLYFLGAYSIILLLFHNLYKTKKVLLPLIFTSIVFGCFHINNVQIDGSNQWYLYLYKIFPLIVLGFGLGLIRLKLNTFWSIIGHFIFNLIPFVFKYIL